MPEPNRVIGDGLMTEMILRADAQRKERAATCQVRLSLDASTRLEQMKTVHGCKSIDEVVQKIFFPLYAEKHLGNNGLGIALKDIRETVDKHRIALGELNCSILDYLPAIITTNDPNKKYTIANNLPNYILEKNRVMEDRKK